MASLVSLFFVFPNGRFVPRWTRLVAVLVGADLLVASFATDGLIFSTPGAMQGSLYVAFVGGLGVGVIAQIHRYRRVSSPLQRQQTKLVVLGLGVLFGVVLLWSVFFELFPPAPGPVRLYIYLVGGGVLYMATLLFPISLAIAILRYRLWDIDTLINRTLVYGLVTAMLSAGYFASVVALQAVFRTFAGGESTIAPVVSTLAIAALFQPARRRVQRLVDRRFYRRRYNAASTLASFSVRARDEVELERLSTALVDAVTETMQPAHASLWLRQRQG